MIPQRVSTGLHRVIKSEYGPWVLNQRMRWLAIQPTSNDGFTYRVHLDELLTPEEMLDVIFRVRAKSWSTPDIMTSLLEAVDNILRPRETLCAPGQSNYWDVNDFIRTMSLARVVRSSEPGDL